ncbi:MAG: M50 family metallopeptidase [Chloroflexota bacterium]
MGSAEVSRQKNAAIKGAARYVVILFLLLFVLLVYTTLHEGGHALTGLLFGGRITDFSVNFWNLSAHVGIDGRFTAAQASAISVAGVSLPLLVWAVYVWLTPRRTNATLSLLRVISAMCVINTLLAWMVIPFLYLYGQAPGDDVTNFLNQSQVQPLLVVGLALAVYLGSWTLLLCRVGGVHALLQDLRGGVTEPFSRDSLASLGVLAVIGLVVAAGVFGASTSDARPVAPPGYTQVAAIDLAQQSYADDTVYRFTLDREKSNVSLYFLLQDVQSGPGQISLVGPDGYQQTFLKVSMEDRMGRATVNPHDLPLSPGEYEVKLTFAQATGKVTFFTKIESY